ncbi:hypothetical protein L1987_08662 [Smallanthus sonchifolius]|uniref:Uncharacterized protein n=1 Tax=Smallanthus sonchifolius TaxID=185202 RepID=A0ACB9JNH3_9ASTR|nr:hypothetical protein L1987_08662 [Smallanthus sonchifolius]
MTWMERGEKTTLEVGNLLERRSVDVFGWKTGSDRWSDRKVGIWVKKEAEAGALSRRTLPVPDVFKTRPVSDVFINKSQRGRDDSCQLQSLPSTTAFIVFIDESQPQSIDDFVDSLLPLISLPSTTVVTLLAKSSKVGRWGEELGRKGGDMRRRV